RGCSGSALNDAKMKCNCEAAGAIRKLGDALIATTQHTRKKRTQELYKQARENGLTMELYRLFREQGLTTKQLWKAIGMKEADQYAWKVEQRVITERRKVRKGVPAKRKEHGSTEEHFKEAADKGISRDMVRGRRKRVWSVERSLTEPPRTRK